MTRSKMQQVIKGTILPNFSQFKQRGRLIYFDDIEELLRGIYFDSSSYNKDTFTVQAFIQPLYLKREHLIFTFGDRIRDEVSHEWFTLETENISTKMIILVNKALEYINQARNASEFYNRLLAETPLIRTLEMLAYTSCYIKHPYAPKDLERFIVELKKEDQNLEWVKPLLDDSEELYSLYCNSPEKVPVFFEAIKKETIANLKLK